MPLTPGVLPKSATLLVTSPIGRIAPPPSQILIDSCASGGRRNDLESMPPRRARTRSDYLISRWESMPHHGIAFWLPYYGTRFYGHHHLSAIRAGLP